MRGQFGGYFTFLLQLRSCDSQSCKYDNCVWNILENVTSHPQTTVYIHTEQGWTHSPRTNGRHSPRDKGRHSLRDHGEYTYPETMIW